MDTKKTLFFGMGMNIQNKEKNMRTSTLATGAFGFLVAAQMSFGAYAPDLPMKGWATQNGSTTGGAGYDTVTVSTLSDLQKYAKAGNKVVFVKAGTYTTSVGNAIQVSGDNLTIYGYQGAIIAQTKVTSASDNTAINITGHNIIIRNLTIKGAGSYDYDAGDCMHIQGDDGDSDAGSNIWIDHVTVQDGEDGNLDVIHAANYVTISWVKFTYTSASTNHQFSNLIGNSATRTTDSGYLKVTLHHNWWADGVKERMPRVRFGQVHVANNLFDSDDNSYNVGPGVGANVLVEGNLFINQNDPLKVYSEGDESTYPIVYSVRNNHGTNNEGSGTVFTPSYTMGITDVSTDVKATALEDSIKAYAGATLADPGTVVSSSSSVASSSSSVKSSSSVASSSSSVVSGTATLEKHGSGSTTQSVVQGTSVDSFYFTWANATGATATGLPTGVTAVVDATAQTITISGAIPATLAAGDYDFTVTTTGAVTNAMKTGTITVTVAGASSSSASVGSSSSGSIEAIGAVNVTASKLSVSPAMTGSALVTLEVNYQGAAKIVLLDVSGRTVMSRVLRVVPGTNEFSVGRGTLPVGAYLLQVNTEFDRLQGRFFIQ